MASKKTPDVDSKVQKNFKDLTIEISKLRVNLTRKVYQKKRLAVDLEALLKAFAKVNQDFELEERKVTKKEKEDARKTQKKKKDEDKEPGLHKFDIPKFEDEELIRHIDSIIHDTD